jgi:RimJ/RimL family protein N-acetyltransferase
VIAETPRLKLRTWDEEDLLPFANLNADRMVMEYFPSTLRFEETQASFHRICAGFQKNGFGLWAAEEKASGQFMGFIGLSIPSFSASFTPCVEIGWRLARPFWDRGFATEGALEALKLGFERHGLAEIVSFTAKTNLRSARVMQKIGMSFAGEFEHPKVEASSSLCRHVLYKMTKQSWST